LAKFSPVLKRRSSKPGFVIPPTRTRHAERQNSGVSRLLTRADASVRRAVRGAAACVTGHGLRAWACGLSLTWLGCSTVDLGDNPEAADLAVDENFFYCEIQPDVLTKYSCASGASGEAGGCHSARSALRLKDVSGALRCKDDRLIGSAPQEAQDNLERIRAEIGIDAESSPFYRRPLGLDSHPRQIFAADSAAAALIRMWLDRGTP
jgi:hypothetical protein